MRKNDKSIKLNVQFSKALMKSNAILINLYSFSEF